jgi:phosphopantetheinyl transferase (holo-ACP synthase)
MHLGHDIIDLALAKQESNIYRKGYLDKILTTQEQKMMRESQNPWLCFWIFWSQKEAVYKILRQKGEERGYYPLKIEIQKTESIWGIVHFKNQIYYTQTKHHEDKLESIALDNPNHFSQIITLTKNTQIFKNQEIPFIKTHHQKQTISKSHHGRFESVITLTNPILSH